MAYVPRAVHASLASLSLGRDRSVAMARRTASGGVEAEGGTNAAAADPFMEGSH